MLKLSIECTTLIESIFSHTVEVISFPTPNILIAIRKSHSPIPMLEIVLILTFI